MRWSLFRRRERQEADPWNRGKLLLLLGVLVAGGLVVVLGIGLAVYYAVQPSEADQSASEAPVQAPVLTTPAGDLGTVRGEDHRDEVAAAPMATAHPSDIQPTEPAPVVADTIEVPAATETGPADIPTGFPATPEGAVGQLAAIDVAVLHAMDVRQAGEVYDAWALPGGVGAGQWVMTENVVAFLGATSNSAAKPATTTVVAKPAAAQIKGVDGSEWVVVCVLLEVRATVEQDAQIGYGHCERMQWEATKGRWMIAPGEPPVQAPSTWPGSAAAVNAGWQTWVEAWDR